MNDLKILVFLFSLVMGDLVTTSCKADQGDLINIESSLLVEGYKLSDQEASNIEKDLKKGPYDLVARIRLLAYYSMKKFNSKTARENCQKNILWLIDHNPDLDDLLTGTMDLDKFMDGQAYEDGKKLWLQKVRKNPENIKIIENAACYLESDDPKIAEDLFKRGLRQEPKSYKWPEKLGNLYHRKWITEEDPIKKAKDARKSLEYYERAFSLPVDQSNKLYLLSYIAREAFIARQLVKARQYSERTLRKAAGSKQVTSIFPEMFIHDPNMILGLVALRGGNVKAAKEFLLRAGNGLVGIHSTSSDTNLSLAKELLERNEKETVVQYFQLLSKYWDKKDDLNKWIAMIKKGETPSFEGHLDF